MVHRAQFGGVIIAALLWGGCVDTPGHSPFIDPLHEHPFIGEASEGVTIEMRSLGQEAYDRAHEVSPHYEELDRRVDARVFEPSAPPSGIVAFTFANNDTHCSIVERYDTLGRSWASRGVVVVIPDSGDLNCQKGSRKNIHDRAVDGIAAAQQARLWYGEELPIVFAGHSRGGGAALLAARRVEAVGAMTLQGIDLVSYGWGTVMPEIPILGITASKDTDLNFPYTEPTEDRANGSYTWATVLGGIHAYTSDSLGLRKKDEPEVSREVQLAIIQMFTNAFIADVMESDAGDDPGRVLRSWEGARELNDTVGEPVTNVRWRDRSADLLLVDDFDSPIRAEDSPQENLVGGANRVEGELRAVEENAYKLEKHVVGIYGAAQALILRGSGVFWSEIPESTDGPAADEVEEPYRVTFRVRCEAECGFDLLVDTGDGPHEFGEADLEGYEYLSPHYVQILSPELDPPPRRIGLRNEGPALVVDDLRLVKAGD